MKERSFLLAPRAVRMAACFLLSMKEEYESEPRMKAMPKTSMMIKGIRHPTNASVRAIND